MCTSRAPLTTTANGNVTFVPPANAMTPAVVFIPPYSETVTFNEVLPNFGLSFRPWYQHMFYLSYAEGLSAPRTDMSLFAPRIITIKIPVDKIRDVIGPGGKMIRSIIERTGVKIDVEDNGTVNVASADGESAMKAIGIIQELTATPELNKTYMGKVQRITDFGAFVEIMPGTDGLLHVSEIANHRVKDVRDELKEGQQVLVKVINIDPTGKIRLSRKALLQDEPGAATEPAGAGKK